MAEENKNKNKILWSENDGKFQTSDKEAYLEYEVRGDTGQKIMDITHTYVPPSKRGLGLASHLCDAAFTHAQKHSFCVVPTCSYVSDTFLPQNPTWNSLVYKKGSRSNI